MTLTPEMVFAIFAAFCANLVATVVGFISLRVSLERRLTILETHLAIILKRRVGDEAF